MRINNIYNQFFVKARLLTTIPIVLFVAGIITLNLNSSVWAKDDDKINSNDSFRMFDIIDGKENTQTNDKGNTQTNDKENTQTNDKGNTQTNDKGNTQTNDKGNTQTNDKGNTQTNDNGNTQSDSGNFQIYNNGSKNCDSKCQKTIDDAMDMMHNLF
jgi:hypothetical protein